ncbi:hard surface induced protein [Grosmannia clavigera kw1407]|uniref:Hard surface induced protein n=1 Tax=Grosmannia clavigera (strain kw1407 / UAMH 11150) TaxID=655863 RepID=F0XT45_GROCL|nr:hard surface induced protein [Grosmannia clavigera kw1407]EFW99275.1 hard surface induced protein [Grosmannia clavigera kw1407]
MLQELLPSFVADTVWPERRPTWRFHATSYLDGLRGLASVIVFICHYTESRHPYFVPTYGLNKDEPSALIQLPYVRLIYSGRPMVHIFFVISGFVLSAKPLQLLHARDTERCYTTLASSLFRRPIRLLLPCAVSTLGIAALCQGGFLYAAAPTVTEQLQSWAGVFFHSISWPWAWDRDLRPGYDIHLWTIPIEFAHSMLLFLVLLALSRMRARLRQFTNVLLVMYCVCSGKWAAFEFLSGMFLAELHVLKKSAKLLGSDSFNSSDAHGRRTISHCRDRTLKTSFHVAILVATLYVAGWPNVGAEKTPGIRYLLAKTPTPFLADVDMPQKFWFGVAAVFTVWSCGEVKVVRRLLEGSFAQYCGRTSYAIYLVHGPGLDYFQDCVLGQPLKPARGDPGASNFVPAFKGSGIKGTIGVQTSTQRVVTWFLGVMILGAIIVWIADLFWRFVDAPIVAFGRVLERAVTDDGLSEIKEQKWDKYAPV